MALLYTKPVILGVIISDLLHLRALETVYQPVETQMESTEFYKEANQMEAGWGSFLRRVDRLRERVAKGLKIKLNEAFYILWCESNQATILKKFTAYCTKKKMGSLRLPLPAWRGLFEDWSKSQVT
jgi:hypothetical protein